MGEAAGVSGWTVRGAGVEDAERLALVGAATFLETFAGVLEAEAIVPHCTREHSAEAYRRYLEGGATAWLAEADPGGAPIGYALSAEPKLPGAGDGDLELKRIYTLSRFHGSGMGTALMDAAVADARERGAKRLLLGVYALNARAIAFYGKNGFAQVATRRFRVGEREYDDVALARVLA
ncbi:N-acetyltransferase family protein [Sphingomonas sp. ID0503]|uniref:GNAT family N-acetyltransferase n=1 Tax=Sphingomonas sp. ID0503 TaxID=3399691 RepID=UPI003AFA296B